jgi:5-methylcytosine-specific restriction endonuclease McrA
MKRSTLKNKADKRRIYEDYIVYSDGRVWSDARNRFLVPSKTRNGYRRVALHHDNDVYRMSLHRLVAMTFMSEGDFSLHVNHIDGNPENNHLSNLEWVSCSDNRRHAYRIGSQRADGVHNGRAKLTFEKAEKIRELVESGFARKDVAKTYNISRQTVDRIINKESRGGWKEESMPKASNRRKLRNKLELKIKKVVKERDKYTCQKCGAVTSGSNCHASHVVPVSRSLRLAYDPLNLKTLCFHCHINWWHKHPVEAGEWFKSKFPERWEYLEEKQKNTTPVKDFELEELYKTLEV